MTPISRYRVNFPYTLEEQQALFRVARAEDVERGGCYDARSAAINLYSHPWTQPATRKESTLLGALYFRWGDAPGLWIIEAEERFAAEDLCHALGTLELKAFGRLKHGDPPTAQG